MVNNDDIKKRTSIGRRISDAFLPYPIKKFLYEDLIFIGPASINGWSFLHI
mgnify:CR=1 FL=1